jgi:NADP-dependent 3-hydroxy acid dehydrogenase YdfG
LERAIERDVGRLDVLVNNAGIILGRPKPSETRLDDMRRVFESTSSPLSR